MWETGTPETAPAQGPGVQDLGMQKSRGEYELDF